MDLLHNIVDTVARFDLGAENIGGIFKNFTLLSMMLTSVTKDNKPFPKTTEIAGLEYDYIIVGAGPAGCVMANRLSENECIKVLLLEAGDCTPLLTEVPAYSRLFFNSCIDWGYQTEPQKHAAFGLEENRVNWNSGKGCGGGSILNAMMYIRGNRKDYDMWEAEGCTGWGYDGVFPYFMKLEDNRNVKDLDPGYHQEGGPQTAERVNYEPEIKAPVLKALKGMNYEERDVNGEKQTGSNDLQGLLRNQQRCSAAKAYLVPAENRPNLDIVTGAFVTQIIIKDRKAIGVKFDHRLMRRKVYARKEVIVSCGSVRTTQLLMLSGIGPKEELEKFNIKVIADLPVGKNLQDHYASTLLYQVNDTIWNVVAKNAYPPNIMDYIINRHGPLASPTQTTVLAFTDGLDGRKASKDFPTQELYFTEYNTLDFKFNVNLKKGIYEKYFARYTTKPLYACISSLLQAKSIGQITLKSTDPYVVPSIQPNYYEDETDLRCVVEGLKICQAVARSEAMRVVQARPLPEAFPGCEEEFQSTNETEYLCCYARHIINSFWHPCGVARMGQPNDSRSVVDPELRVIGVQSLRVVNMAVMPIIPSANTDVPTLMIAEKAYDLMKEDCKCPGIPTVPIETSTVGIKVL